jgi:hypothetical protein
MSDDIREGDRVIWSAAPSSRGVVLAVITEPHAWVQWANESTQLIPLSQLLSDEG